MNSLRLNSGGLVSWIKQCISLRSRNWARIKLGLYPKELQTRYPDIADVDLGRGDVVIDVGANIGQFSEVALAYNPLIELHAFEPIPAVFKELSNRMAAFGDVKLSNCALGSQSTQGELKVRRFDECTSLLNPTDKLEQGLLGLDLSVEDTIRIEISTLDEYVKQNSVEQIKLIKLDVQGYELEVLKGAEHSLKITDWIYLEAQIQELYVGAPTFSEIASYLKSRRFAIVRMCAFKYDENEELFECDMLFKRD